MVRSEGSTSLKNPVTPPGIDSGTVRLVAQRLNHYATPGPDSNVSYSVKYVTKYKSPVPVHGVMFRVLWKHKSNV
jgi:hypothetical protein